ncbi:MAG: aspartate ammonia-lyase [Methylovirgula sp.]
MTSLADTSLADKSLPRMRIEHDLLGEREVPQEALYGIQTLRAAENFRFADLPISHFPSLIRALAMVKKAAACANGACGLLSPEKEAAIRLACDDVISGALDDSFIVDVFQGGAGTSSNMNMNEVIANRGLEHMGRPHGDYAALHPNDDVNMSQSTNDAYPTAVRLAIIMESGAVATALQSLIAVFAAKAQEFANVVKIGRTQLQDAVPIRLGQEFGAYAVTLREDVARIAEAAQLFREINLGGTAVGTSLNADPLYAARAVAELSAISGIELVQAEDLLEASWDTGAYVLFSGVLKRVAVKLSKIANDLRLLSSGPRAGFGEIRLPAMQPGSSIMPGKVNPVIPEAVNQICFQVIGNDLTVTMAAEAGQLQLNAFEPVIAYNILTSMRLLARAMETLATRCVAGITADEIRCRAGAEASVALAAALVPIIGYEQSVEIAKLALASGRTIREVALDAGLDRQLVETLLDPIHMTGPEPKAPLGKEAAE